jgi:hypothetical protein
MIHTYIYIYIHTHIYIYYIYIRIESIGSSDSNPSCLTQVCLTANGQHVSTVLSLRSLRAWENDPSVLSLLGTFCENETLTLW